MANHVYFNINIETNEEGRNALQSMYDKHAEMRPWGEIMVNTLEAHDLPIYDTPYNEDDWYSWGCDNMGAKWVNIEDFDQYSISGYSAWSPVIPIVENLTEYLSKFDSNVTISMTYEDEFRNFFGYYDTESFNGTVVADHYEIEDSEFVECLEGAFGKGYNENEDFDWWEEYTLENGDTIIPSEFADEVVYNFFITKELQLPE